MFEDIILSSDDEDKKSTAGKALGNPVIDCLTVDLNNYDELIRAKKQKLQEITQFANNVLQQISSHDSINCSPSDLATDHYTIDGAPILRKKKKTSKPSILSIKSVWQKVIDHHWIVGVYLVNKSSWQLTDCKFYVNFSDADEIIGTSHFWEKQTNFWSPVSEIPEYSEDIAAVVVLDLPRFDKSTLVKIDGCIFAKVEDQLIQTPIDEITLSTYDVMSEKCSLKLSSSVVDAANILACKSIGLNRTLIIDLNKKFGTGRKVYDFLEKYSFRDIESGLYVSDYAGGSISMVEIVNLDEESVSLRIYARNASQINVIVQELRKEFYGCIDEDEDDLCKVAAQTLLRELELYFESKNPADWQRARVETDSLIP